jgi:hypothetical protein
MKRGRHAALLVVAFACAGFSCAHARSATLASDESGVFVGGSPCGEAIRRVLGISTDEKCDLIMWTLTLHEDPSTHAPLRYELRCKYGPTTQGRPGVARGAKTLRREGAVNISLGIESRPEVTVYDLDGGLSLFRAGANVLHMINPDRTLMIGNGGWSYSLSREDRSAQHRHRSQPPEMSYQISDPETGPAVFGIFEGRTPCQEIAHALQVDVPEGCHKAKWRVTLFQDPGSRSPTTYKVEGSLYWQSGPQQGDWSMARGAPDDPGAVVYRLVRGDKSPLLLSTSDGNVVFLLDQDERLLVGHEEFSYTLNRRNANES